MEGPNPQIMYLNKGEERREDVGGKKEKRIVTQNLFCAFSFLFFFFLYKEIAKLTYLFSAHISQQTFVSLQFLA